MVDFGKSDKTIKISGKGDKPNTYNGVSSNNSFFIQLPFFEFFHILTTEEMDKTTVKIQKRYKGRERV